MEPATLPSMPPKRLVSADWHAGRNKISAIIVIRLIHALEIDAGSMIFSSDSLFKPDDPWLIIHFGRQAIFARRAHALIFLAYKASRVIPRLIINENAWLRMTQLTALCDTG